MNKLTCLTGTLTVLLTSITLAAPALATAPGANGDIVYQRFYKGGSEIFSFDPATKKSTRLTSNKVKSGDAVSAGDPAYSANGRKVVFINAVKVGPGARRNNVFVMRADGSKPRQLTESKAHISDPAFSPDGSQIVFTVGGDIHAIDADGSNERNLTAALPGGGLTASYSPDGSRIAIASGGDIVLIDPDGSNPATVTTDGYSPSFSPDGSRIAFASSRNDSSGGIFVVNVDGTNVVELADKEGIEDYDPSFSPDGTKVAYTSRLNDRSALGVFSVPSTGGASKELIRASNAPSNPDWGVAVP